MSVEIVPYEPRLLGGIAELQTRLWSPDPALNRRYFSWKHERNPCWPRPEVFLALEGGQVVAMRGFFGSRWEGGVQEDAAILPMATDAVVAAGQENTGVTGLLMARALVDLAALKFPFVLNLNASPVTLVSSLASGWRATAPLQTVIRCETSPATNRVRKRLLRLPLVWRLAQNPLFDAQEERRPFAGVDAAGRSRLPRLSRHLRLECEPRVAGMADLIRRIGHDGRLRQVRDAGWLAWRYANPLAAYRFICWEDGRLEGFVALEKSLSRNADRLRISIVDCEAADPAIMESLLGAVIAATADLPVLAWRRALPAMAAAALDRLGFRPHAVPGALAHQRPCVLVKGLTHPTPAGGWRLGGVDMLEIANWDLRRLYGD